MEHFAGSSKFLLIELFDQGVVVSSLPSRPNALDGEKTLAVMVQEAAIPLVRSLVQSRVIESTFWEGKIQGAMKEQIKQTKRAKTRTDVTTTALIQELETTVGDLRLEIEGVRSQNVLQCRQLEAQTFDYQSYLKLNEEVNKVQVYILNAFSGDLMVDTLPKDQDHASRVVSIMRIQEQRISDLKGELSLEQQIRLDADEKKAKAQATLSIIGRRNWLARLLNVGVAALLLVTVGSAAQTPSPAPPSTPPPAIAAAPVVPTISSDLRAKFWRAQADNITAQSNAEKAREMLNTAVTALRDACGTKANLAVDGAGEPTCNKIPDPPPAPAKHVAAPPTPTSAKPEAKK